MTAKQILQEAIVIQESKGHDYTTNPDENQFENFERVASVVSWFKNPQDQVFVSLLMTKIARLAVLLDAKKPKHESIEDTFIDLTNYSALWGGKRLQNERHK